MFKKTSGQIDIRVVILFAFIFVFTLILGKLIIKMSANLVLGAVVGIAFFILCFISVNTPSIPWYFLYVTFSGIWHQNNRGWGG